MEKEKKEQQWLAEHDRLARLFREDRFAFELERKRLIKESIDQFNNTSSLRTQQQKLEKILRGSASTHNRLVLMQALFWDQVINRFIPALQNLKSQTSRQEIQKDKRTCKSLALVIDFNPREAGRD